MNESMFREYAKLVKQDPAIIAEIADKFSYQDSVRLTYFLANDRRYELLWRYRQGLSKQPGYSYYSVDRYPHEKRGFIQGPISYEEAEDIASDNHPEYIVRLTLKKTGVWESDIEQNMKEED